MMDLHTTPWDCVKLQKSSKNAKLLTIKKLQGQNVAVCFSSEHHAVEKKQKPSWVSWRQTWRTKNHQRCRDGRAFAENTRPSLFRLWSSPLDKQVIYPPLFCSICLSGGHYEPVRRLTFTTGHQEIISAINCLCCRQLNERGPTLSVSGLWDASISAFSAAR